MKELSLKLLEGHKIYKTFSSNWRKKIYTQYIQLIYNNWEASVEPLHTATVSQQTKQKIYTANYTNTRIF